MDSEPLFHLALAADWERDTSSDYTTSTLGMSLADVGFIHCSFRHQVQGVADRFYRGRDDVRLLRIDAALVTAEIVVEDTTGAGEAFPHIYGPLNRAAVVSVTPFDP